MATYKTINELFAALEKEVKRAVLAIIAEIATEYFKQRFTEKGWDGTPWVAAKRPVSRGSLMVRSGGLVNSIKPSLVTPSVVRISAGGSHIPYAQVHNEGGTVNVKVTPRMRKFAWAQHYKEVGNDKDADTMWKRLALTKKESLQINIPQRKFMGHSQRLNAIIIGAIAKEFNI